MVQRVTINYDWNSDDELEIDNLQSSTFIIEDCASSVG